MHNILHDLAYVIFTLVQLVARFVLQARIQLSETCMLQTSLMQSCLQTSLDAMLTGGKVLVYIISSMPVQMQFRAYCLDMQCICALAMRPALTVHRAKVTYELQAVLVLELLELQHSQPNSNPQQLQQSHHFQTAWQLQSSRANRARCKYPFPG